jgi:hypothetical protein
MIVRGARQEMGDKGGKVFILERQAAPSAEDPRLRQKTFRATPLNNAPPGSWRSVLSTAML